MLTTLAGMESSGTVRASQLKRAVLRKDPTFNEADLGFRGFGALLASLATDGMVTLSGDGDKQVTLSGTSAQADAERLLVSVLENGPVPMSGLKTAMRKQDDAFSERKLGHRTFTAFVRSVEAQGLIEVRGEDDERTVHKRGPRGKR